MHAPAASGHPLSSPQPSALPCASSPQLDELDQNAAVNKAGGVVGAFTPVADQVSTDSLAPYRCGGNVPAAMYAQGMCRISCAALFRSLHLMQQTFRSLHHLV